MGPVSGRRPDRARKTKAKAPRPACRSRFFVLSRKARLGGRCVRSPHVRRSFSHYASSGVTAPIRNQECSQAIQVSQGIPRLAPPYPGIRRNSLVLAAKSRGTSEKTGIYCGYQEKL